MGARARLDIGGVACNVGWESARRLGGKGDIPMDTMTITIESDSGTRMRFQVDHEPRFNLRSEEVDGLRSTVRTVESTLAEPDEGRMCLVLARLTLESILEALPPEDEQEEEEEA
jgi:hypothetical protein